MITDALILEWRVVTHRCCDPFACCADDSTQVATLITYAARRVLAPYLFPQNAVEHALAALAGCPHTMVASDGICSLCGTDTVEYVFSVD